MTFDQLQEQVFELMGAGKLAEAEQRLMETQAFFSGKSLGRWYRLQAALLRRLRPDDHLAFDETCTTAARLLQGDPEGLCLLYLTQISASMVAGNWHAARVHIRRLRAMARRHAAQFEIQKLQGLVRINEGLVERASGNFDRATSLLEVGTEIMQRYLYPEDERTRANIIAMAYLDIADSYLRMRQHGKAVEWVSKVDPTQIPAHEYGRYCYVQSRYWLALGLIDQAEEWSGRIGSGQSWDPDLPALRLEVQAQIAHAQGQTQGALDLFYKALEHTVSNNNHVLSSVLRQEIYSRAKELKS